jgi:hypothetical protein
MDKGILMVILLCSIVAAIAAFAAVAFSQLWHALDLVESRNEN